MTIVCVAHLACRATPAVVFFPQGCVSLEALRYLTPVLNLYTEHTKSRPPSSPTTTLFSSEMPRFHPPSWLPQTSVVSLSLVRPLSHSQPNYIHRLCVDADPYIPNGYGAQWYTNQNNLYVAVILLYICFLSFLFSFRSVRNFVIDLRQVAGGATGIHWQVSQATSLINLVFQMSTAAGNQHQGEPC